MKPQPHALAIFETCRKSRGVFVTLSCILSALPWTAPIAYADYFRYQVSPGDTLGEVLDQAGVCPLWGEGNSVSQASQLNDPKGLKNTDPKKWFKRGSTVFLPIPSTGPVPTGFKLTDEGVLVREKRDKKSRSQCSTRIARYQFRKGDTIGKVLDSIGVCPLWGKGRSVEQVLTLNGYSPELQGSDIAVGAWLKIPFRPGLVLNPNEISIDDQLRLSFKLADTSSKCSKPLSPIVPVKDTPENPSPAEELANPRKLTKSDSSEGEEGDPILQTSEALLSPNSEIQIEPARSPAQEKIEPQIEPQIEPIKPPTTAASIVTINPPEMEVDLSQFQITPESQSKVNPPPTETTNPVISPPLSPDVEKPSALSISLAGTTGFSAIEGYDATTSTSGFLASNLGTGFGLQLNYEYDNTWISSFEITRISYEFLEISNATLLDAKQSYSTLQASQSVQLPWGMTPSLTYRVQEEAGYHATIDDEIQLDQLQIHALGLGLTQSIFTSSRSKAEIYFNYFYTLPISTSEYEVLSGSEQQFGVRYELESKSKSFGVGTSAALSIQTQNTSILELGRKKLMIGIYFKLPTL